MPAPTNDPDAVGFPSPSGARSANASFAATRANWRSDHAFAMAESTNRSTRSHAPGLRPWSGSVMGNGSNDVIAEMPDGRRGRLSKITDPIPMERRYPPCDDNTRAHLAKILSVTIWLYLPEAPGSVNQCHARRRTARRARWMRSEVRSLRLPEL